MATDTSEKGLETLIMGHMTGLDGLVLTVNEHSIFNGVDDTFSLLK
jgi:hypothetical protein